MMLNMLGDQVNCSSMEQGRTTPRELSISAISDLALKFDNNLSSTVKTSTDHGVHTSSSSSASGYKKRSLYEKNHDITGQQWPVNRTQSGSSPVSPSPQTHMQLKWTDCDTLDMLPKAMSFTWFDIVLDLFSIFCYILDVVSDVVTAYVHYYTKNWTFFHLTVFFIAVPSFVTTMISLRWYIVDAKNGATFVVSRTRWALRTIFLVIQMGQIMRYIDSLYFGIKYMKSPNVKYYQYMVNEDTDATMLRLFECFMESAPQLLIQLYIIMETTVKYDRSNSTDFIFYVIFPYFSCCISLFSIALALVSYYKSLRMSLPNKINLTIMQMTVQVVWRLLMLASRVLALTLFITIFEQHIIYVLAIHWLIMFLWILSMRTRFCDHRIEEVIYNALIAVMFIFCYFNPIDNDTRYRYSFFYSVMLFENSLLLYLWYSYIDPGFPHKELYVFAYYSLFTLGALVMIYYYLCHHPTRGIKIFRDKVDYGEVLVNSESITRESQRRNFNPRDWATEHELELLLKMIEQRNGVDENEFKRIGKVKRRFTIDASSNAHSPFRPVVSLPNEGDSAFKT